MTEPITEIQAPNFNWWLVGIGLLCGLLLGGFVVHWFDSDNPVTITKTLIQKVPVHVNVPAPTAQEVVKVERVAVPAKQVIAYKPEAKKTLHLPKEVQDAPEQQVLSAATVQPDDHPQTVTTVLDTRTGESRQFVQAEPLPWLAQDRRGEISADLIEKFGGPVVRIQARQELFQVKAVHFHVMAFGDVPVPIFGMAGRPDVGVGFGLHGGW